MLQEYESKDSVQDVFRPALSLPHLPIFDELNESLILPCKRTKIRQHPIAAPSLCTVFRIAELPMIPCRSKLRPEPEASHYCRNFRLAADLL
jgi:hypothetical protein